MKGASDRAKAVLFRLDKIGVEAIFGTIRSFKLFSNSLKSLRINSEVDVDDPVEDEVDNPVEDEADDPVEDDEVDDQVEDETDDPVEDEVDDPVEDEVEGRVDEEVFDLVKYPVEFKKLDIFF